MTFLPPELIIEIARHLCFHCQYPTAFPTAEVDHVHSDKQALARLCLASRSFCAIARPILYHFFIPRWSSVSSSEHVESDDTPYENLDAGDTREARKPKDDLPRFIHTLHLNPDLAAQLVSIHLAPRVPCPKLRKRKDPSTGPLVPPANGEISWISWLMCFTAKCPRLSTAVIDLTVNRDVSFLGPDPDYRNFPSLRRVALVTIPKTWVPYEMSYINRVARNLDELVCRGPNLRPRPHHHGPSSTMTAGALPYLKRGIKRFVGVGVLSIGSMSHVPEEFPQLEWLEYYQRRDSWPGPDSLPLPVSLISNSLRGLCIDFAPQVNGYPAGSPTLFPDVWSLRGPSPLVRLEHLSVYCDALNHAARIQLSEIEDGMDLLVRLLPPGIRTLRISWVDTDMELPLQGLAEVARQRFSHLEKVGVGFSEEAIAKESSSALGRIPIANAIKVVPLFAAQGVKMGWAIDTWGPSPVRTRSGERIGGDGLILPEFPLTLEGPEWHFAGDHGKQEPWSAVHEAWLAIRDLEHQIK